MNTKFGLSFLGKQKREEEEMRREGRRKSRKVWNAMILYGKVWIFVWKNQTINPFFYEFGYKRTLLGILVVFGSFRLDLELFWFGFVVDLGLYGN